MKVLILDDERWDSGLSSYAVQIGALLKASGSDVSFAGLSDKKPVASATRAGLKILPINGFWDVFKILGEFKWDLVNAHTGRTHSWAVLARALRNIPANSMPIIRTRGDARPLKANFFARMLYRRTQGVIAASEHIGRQYQEELGVPAQRLEVIFPGVMPEASPTALPSQKIGILGRLDPVKGHTLFLEACAGVLKEFPEVQIFIAGGEANVTYSLLKNQARELGIEQKIQFLGYQASALDFMRSCGLGVIASLGSEEVSRACLEWMSVGRPVVGTIVGCLPELIEPEETGLLVPPNDSEALKHALVKALSSPQELSKWGKNGHRQIQEKYSPAVMLSKTLEFFYRVKSA